MVVGNVPEAVDFVVVGSGPGGYTAALEAARRGRRVTLIDPDGDDGIGGVCLRVGCIPSKTLIEAAETFHRTLHGAAMGITASDVRFDMVRFQRWKDERVQLLAGGVAGLLKRANVTVKRGHLRIAEPGTVVVSDGDGGAQFLMYEDLLLATGSSPMPLSVLPVDGTRVVDSTGALALEHVPETVAVVGAGYIGLELGTALAKLGAAVTIVEAADRILPSMDASLNRPLKRRLGELRVEVKLDAEVYGADEQHLLARQNGADLQIPAELVVVAVGRRPNTGDLGLEDAGVAVDEIGLIPVDENRTAAPRIAAVGDITPGPALAHKATAEARVAVAALNGQPAAFSPQAIPIVVFSDPEIASVGVGAVEADEAGVDVRKTTLPITASGRAATMGQRIGYAECVSDEADGALLGVTLVGPHASELIAEASLAIEMGVTLEDLSLTIHPHPTLSEQFQELALSAGGVGPVQPVG